MNRLLIAASAAVFAVGMSACAAGGTDSSASGDSSDYPSESLDWTIAFGPGGGNDIMARKMIDIIEKEDLYPGDISAENRDGGSGAQGWGYVYSHSGDPYHVSTTSGSFLTTPLQSDTGWTYEDFTSVGLFATDDALFLVDGKKNITTWKDWVSWAKKQDEVVVGGIGTVNVDFILHSKIAEAAGYDIKYVPYDEEGQVQTSLLSGALDAMVSNPGSILGQVESGDMTPLLFTGKKPLEALPKVPTGESVGIEDLPSMPRGLILAPDVDEDVRQWWIDTSKEIVKTDEWQEYLDKNYLSEDVRWGDDFDTYLEETVNDFETTLEEQGAL